MKITFSLLLFIGFLLTACRGAPTSSPTSTVSEPSARPTETALPLPTPTRTQPPPPTQTITRTEAPPPMDTPTLAPTSTSPPLPRPTSTSAPPTDTPAPEATAPPRATDAVSPIPTNTPLVCAVLPEGGFLTVWQSDPALQSALGCPTSGHPRIVPAAWEIKTAFQTFERGVMIWSDHAGWYPQPLVYVLYPDGRYQKLQDASDPGVDPVSAGETPPEGLVEPMLGFGKVWREGPGVREALGWATAEETPGEGRFQMYWGGDMVWISQTDKIYAFAARAHVFDVSFFDG
jgi:hypothetical protein